MLTLSQLEGTGSFICAYFLGKWDVDKSVRLIPALELHMPPTLRSHTKKQNAGHRQVDDGTGAKGEKRNCTQATLDGDDIQSKQKKARRPVSKVVTKSAKLVSSHSPFSAQTVRKDIVFKICSPAGRTRKARAVGLDTNASLMNESRYNLRQSGKKCVNSKQLNESVNCSDSNRYRDKDNKKLNCKSSYEVKSTPILAKSGQQEKSVGELSDIKATRNKRKAQVMQMRNCSVVAQNIQTINEKVSSTLHNKISKVSRGVNAEEQKCTKLNDNKAAEESDTYITSKGPVEMRNSQVSLDNCLPNIKTQFRSDRENTHSETTTCQVTTDSLITDSVKTEDIEGKVLMLKPANKLLEMQSKRKCPSRGVKRSFNYCDKENIESPNNERRIRRNRTVVIDYSQTESELEWLDAQLEKTFATSKTKYYDDDDSWTANSKTKPRSAKDKDITRQEKKHKKKEDKEKQKRSKEERKELECGDNNSNRRVTKRKEKENKTSQQKREKPSKNKEKLDNGKNNVAIEDCSVTAKPGTLKYLKQVNSLTDACARVEEAEDDFFGSEFGKKKKKTNELQNLLLMPTSHDDSFTIKTPKGKSQGSDVITPRTNLLGMWETATTPSAVTPSTSSPNSTTKAAQKKDALEVMFRHMQDRKGRPRGIRKALQNNKASESILEDVRQLPPVELPKLPEIPDMSGESSCDEYFNTSNG